MARLVASVSLLLVFLVAAPAAPAQSLADGLEYARAVARAQVALAQDADLRRYHLRVRSSEGGVTLSGQVSSETLRAHAESVTRHALGNARIDNRIEITRRERIPLPPRATRQAATEPPPAQREAQAAERQQAEAQHHTVRAGETLSSIARQHRTTVAEIQRLNNLRGTNIRAGQRLRVR